MWWRAGGGCWDTHAGGGIGTEEKVEDWGKVGGGAAAEREGPAAEGCDEGVSNKVDGDAWGEVEEDVRERDSITMIMPAPVSRRKVTGSPASGSKPRPRNA